MKKIWRQQTSEQTVLTENLRSLLTQLKTLILFWFNWNLSEIYPTWECKEADFYFPFKKGHVAFYCNCKLSYLFHSTLSQLDRRRMFFVLFTKKKTISGFWQTFYSIFEMEVIEESDFNPNISTGTYKFVLWTKPYLKYLYKAFFGCLVFKIVLNINISEILLLVGPRALL